ncbi:SWF or SNF family helicase [Streptomyces sp. PU-14G]|uniref:SWF or SNF family helicase n=1 Tax=Streptomyces sp. PU-14G TaxID=2800808 RepID=UPI0034E05073
MPPAQGRGFARTWWGQTWLKALEDTALDGQQLKRGRRLAREGAVGAVSVRPGRITAVVRGADRAPCRADVLLRELDESEWDRLLDVIVEQAGHIAALLDRDMPPRLVEDAADAGLELLPGIGDLDPECTCEAWDHCPHTAALSYQMARLLDEDPFALLLLRGRGERELVDALQTRSSTRAAVTSKEAETDAAGAALEGVDAAEAFALGAVLPPLPTGPAPVPEPGRVAVLTGASSDAPGLDLDALGFLVSDAGARARRMLTEARSPGHADSPLPRPLTQWQDAARLAASRPGHEITARLATGCGRSEEGLARAAAAWSFGGAEALAVLDEEWSPATGVLRRAQQQLDAAVAEGESPCALRGTGTRWSAEGTDAQLRLGPDGRWWPYRRRQGRWWPVGGPERNPAEALTTALAEDGEAAADGS